MDSLPDLEMLAEFLREVGLETLMRASEEVSDTRKADGSVVTAADLATQHAIQAGLQAHWPEYRFLGEEMSREDQRRLYQHSSGGLWCLDPLDGTSNFATGLPFFSISLALLIDRDIRLGVVYDPQRDEFFAAIKGRGATLNGRTLRCRRETMPLENCIAVVDFKRLPQEMAVRLASEPPYRSQRSFGSVALDWCWLAANRYQVYVHGKQNLWDYAAGSLILAEAGGYSESLEGGDVYQHGLAPRSVMAACNEVLLGEWRRALLGASPD